MLPASHRLLNRVRQNILEAVTPASGSCTVHIYTQTIHRMTQNKQYIEQHKNKQYIEQHKNIGSFVWAVYVLCSLLKSPITSHLLGHNTLLSTQPFSLSVGHRFTATQNSR
jgi:hypothetical protein